MKNNLEMMSDIKNDTYKQIEMNLPSDEFLITSLTIYDKNNSLAINLFLTNTAIFMQESNDIEKIKKRTFIKIVDIKLTSNEFYIEFQNGYKIIGDTIPCQEEVNRFFECIKANTTIKTSSSKELENNSYDIPEVKEIPRYNPFGNIMSSKPKEQLQEVVQPEYVRTLTDDFEDKKKDKQKNKKMPLIIGGIIGAIALITTIIIVIVMVGGNKKDEVSPEVLMVQNRRNEILQYQIDANALYDYSFNLTSYYEEYSANFSTQSKLDIEKEFSELKKDYENKYKDKKYQSSSQAYKIYEVSKIDSWMNENITLLTETFELYEEIIDEDYRDDSNIISLQGKLTTLDTKIKKAQDCLSEEKTALDKILGIQSADSDSTKNQTKSDDKEKTKEEEETTEKENTNSSDNTKENESSENSTENNTNTEKTTTVKTTNSEQTNKTTKKVENGSSEFQYENEKTNSGEKKPEGKQGNAAYTGE
jgi:hypothetical protein